MLKLWGGITSCLVNEHNCIFSVSISRDTFAVSKDVVLLLHSFHQHMAISVGILLETS